MILFILLMGALYGTLLYAPAVTNLFVPLAVQVSWSPQAFYLLLIHILVLLLVVQFIRTVRASILKGVEKSLEDFTINLTMEDQTLAALARLSAQTQNLPGNLQQILFLLQVNPKQVETLRQALDDNVIEHLRSIAQRLEGLDLTGLSSTLQEVVNLPDMSEFSLNTIDDGDVQVLRKVAADLKDVDIDKVVEVTNALLNLGDLNELPDLSLLPDKEQLEALSTLLSFDATKLDEIVTALINLPDLDDLPNLNDLPDADDLQKLARFAEALSDLDLKELGNQISVLSEISFDNIGDMSSLPSPQEASQLAALATALQEVNLPRLKARLENLSELDFRVLGKLSALTPELLDKLKALIQVAT